MAGVHASTILKVYSALFKSFGTIYTPTSSFLRNYIHFDLQRQCV